MEITDWLADTQSGACCIDLVIRKDSKLDNYSWQRTGVIDEIRFALYDPIINNNLSFERPQNLS